MRRVLEPRLKANKINMGPMEKERFLFQLQEVESSRHMAFHGEGVSVEEAAFSLTSMKYGIIREYEDETGESQPNARSAEGCDSPCRIRVRAL